MISAFPSSNTLLLIDSRSNIERLMGILRMVDVETAGEMKLFQLTYASAQDLAKTLELLFQSAAAGAAPGPGAPRPAGAPGGRPRRAARSSGSSRSSGRTT